MPTKAPSLLHACRLKCIYCGSTPLLKKGSWFNFQEGCDACKYKYEREEGYFTGAAWMITYTVTCAPSIATAALLLWLVPSLHSLVIVAIASLVAIVVGIGFMPFGKSLWLYLDHKIHPLE